MKKNISLVNNDAVIAERELETGYITYYTLAQRVGDMVLCNTMGERYGTTLELLSGNDYNEEDDKYYEIFQWYIITDTGAEHLRESTDELVFYDRELDLNIWGITHYGTSWKYVFTDIRATDNIDDLF